MEYETRFGVKVDTRIPEEVRARLCDQWDKWVKGDLKDGPSGQLSLLTRYEHFIMGSGIGLPPDPFKPLALQHRTADLEGVIRERKRVYPPGKEYKSGFYPFILPGFEDITGLRKKDHLLAVLYPEINADGRIRIPRVVAVYDYEDKKMELSQDVISRLQLPISRAGLKLDDGVIVREVFDFDGGYRIELV